MSNCFFVAKLTVKNFRKIFYSQFHYKTIRHFFRKIRKKTFLPQKKRDHKEKIGTIFPGKFDMAFRWVLAYWFVFFQ